MSRLPIETLNIHRSFINDIEYNRDSAELVKAIISMAHSLRLTLVAEGVEEASQQAFRKIDSWRSSGECIATLAITVRGRGSDSH
ncbi:EAL domain-containing protein [Pseudomonas sp. D3-10]|uniref:EAL domain-containing protein n=1 Tax=Pseudomonas sp. D3-10 TaxID=2817392 RepID=UPI003DA8C2E9